MSSSSSSSSSTSDTTTPTTTAAVGSTPLPLATPAEQQHAPTNVAKGLPTSFIFIPCEPIIITAEDIANASRRRGKNAQSKAKTARVAKPRAKAAPKPRAAKPAAAAATAPRKSKPNMRFAQLAAKMSGGYPL